MTIPQLRRLLERALDNVNRDIAANTDRDSMYSRGLAHEGYSGGYAKALNDVLLLTNNVVPNDSRTIHYWTDPETPSP